MIALLLLPLLVAQAATTTITNVEACKTCRIRIEPVARVAGRSAEEGPNTFAEIVRDSRGFFYVAPTFAPGRVSVFDAQGRFVRAVGRLGKGPGELNATGKLVIGPGDSLWVYDAVQARLTVFDRDGKFGRMMRKVGVVSEMAIARDGTIAFQSDPWNRAAGSKALQIANANAETKHSFGWTPPARALPGLVSSALVWADSASFWSVRLDQYLIEQYDRNGKLLKSMRRDAPWFRVHEQADGKRTSARVRDVAIDAQGRLWVLAALPQTSWQEEPADGSAGAYSAGQMDRKFDAIVEVIDPRKGQLLRSVRYDRSFGSLIGPDLLVGKAEDDLGRLSFDVYRLTLVGAR